MKRNLNIEILKATSEEHLNDVKRLISEFVKWHLQRHIEDIRFTNDYFDQKDLEKELSSLPGKYSMLKAGFFLRYIIIHRPVVWHCEK